MFAGAFQFGNHTRRQARSGSRRLIPITLITTAVPSAADIFTFSNLRAHHVAYSDAAAEGNSHAAAHQILLLRHLVIIQIH